VGFAKQAYLASQESQMEQAVDETRARLKEPLPVLRPPAPARVPLRVLYFLFSFIQSSFPLLPLISEVEKVENLAETPVRRVVGSAGFEPTTLTRNARLAFLHGAFSIRLLASHVNLRETRYLMASMEKLEVI